MSVPSSELLELLRGEGLAVDPGIDPESLDRASEKEYRFDPQRTVSMLAERLEALHSLDPVALRQSTPLPVITMDAVTGQARAATQAAPDAPIDAAYAHMNRPELLEVLEGGVARLGEVDEAELVVTHGSPDLDALLCAGGEAVGFSRWDGVAVADRHRDLAHAASALAVTIGPMMVPEFFLGYGTRPDPARLDWWLLAAQLLPSTARPRASGRNQP